MIFLVICSCSSPTVPVTEAEDQSLFIKIDRDSMSSPTKSTESQDTLSFSFDFHPEKLDSQDTLQAMILNTFVKLYVDKVNKSAKGNFWSGQAPEIRGSGFTVYEYNNTYTANFNLDTLQYEISGKKGNFKIRKINRKI